MEFPHLQKIQTDYKDKNVAVVMISTDQDRPVVPAYLRKHRAAATVLRNENQVDRAYRVQGVPVTLVIDQKGIVRYHKAGFKFGDEIKLRETIESLLHSAENPTPPTPLK